MNFKTYILKVIFVAILFILPDKNIFSQVGLYPEIEWQNALGGTYVESGYSSLPTSDGGFIITGGSRSTNGDVTGNHGSGDYWVVKLDSLGIIEWQKSLGNSYLQWSFSIIQTTDDGYLVTGYSYGSSGDVGENYDDTNETNDAWLVKLSSSGVIEWENSYGGSDDDSAGWITPAADGGYVLTGSTASNDYDVSGQHGGYRDAWVFKIDDIGNIEWQNCLGGSDTDAGSCLINTLDGGYIMCGSSSSNDGDVTGNHGEGDGWVVKLSSTGMIEWQKCFGGTSYDHFSQITQTFEGEYIVVGETQSIDGDVSGHHGYNDLWVVKFSGVGDIIWQKCYGGTAWEDGRAIAEVEDGFIVTGHAISTNGDILSENHGLGDYWLLKINDGGDILWEHCYGGTDGEIPFSLSNLIDGYLISGVTYSEDGDVIEMNGYSDYWILKLKPECLHSIYFADLDEDGFGNSLFDSISCNIPFGYVLDSTDCDDTNPLINPGITDICNSFDDNCNFLIDEDAVFINWFADLDGDTYGDVFNDSMSCYTLTGFVADSNDCDDTNPFINPAALDSCNSLDDNCNFLIDEDAIFTLYYADADGDTYGDLLSDSSSCFILSGYVIDSTDCNDMDPLINPAAEESCNGADDNCDGNIDEGLTTHTLYLDADGDSYGDPIIDTVTCATGLIGYVSDSTDCDDSNPLIYLGAEEIFNGLDDNCDKLIDEGLNTADITEGLFMIYPNPAENILFIDYRKAAEANIQIIDISGQIIYSNIISKPPFEINIEKFPTGFYLVKLIVGEGEFVAIFIKE